MNRCFIKILILGILPLFLINCNNNNCAKYGSQNGLDLDCCPIKDSTINLLPKSSIKQVNVFLETSGSMKGFMPVSTPATKFQMVMPDFLSKLNSNSRINYNFYSIKESNSDCIKLEAKGARESILYGKFDWGLNTYIPTMLDSVNAYLNNDVVNILITDGIYEPKEEKETSQAITDIREIMKGGNNYSTSLFCVFSDYRLTKKNIEVSPYYLIVRGKPENIKEVEKMLRSLIKESKQTFEELNLGFKYDPPFYSILPYFETTENFVAMSCTDYQDAYISIQEIELKKENTATTFWVGVNLKSYPDYCQQNNYLMENLELKLGSGEVIIKDVVQNITNLAEKEEIDLANKMTHFIQLEITDMGTPISILEISLKYKLPTWYIALNEDNIKANGEKTYGLKNIVEGFTAAYKTDDINNQYLFRNLKISLIKK